MHPSVRAISDSYKKPHIVDVKSGDSVRVHQKIKEGSKERVQVFEGLVIKVSNKNSSSARITVRRSSGAVAVEKSYLLHSPLVIKVEITKRSKVRRNYLTYMRERTGKAARLASLDFDKEAVNKIPEVEADKPQEENALEKDKEEAEVNKADDKPEEKIDDQKSNKETSK